MKIRFFRCLAAVFIATLAMGCSDGGQETGSIGGAGNIILFIGDGMGAAQRKAARWASAGETGSLSMDALASAGELATYSADSIVTDSAAAATAMATGEKTNNGVVAMDVDLFPLTTILEEAKLQGRSVGLVTTTQITHATPAAFSSHVEDRNLMTEIALQMAQAGLDVLLGGGEDEFLPAGVAGCHPEPGERADGRDLIGEAVENDYTHVCDAESLAAVDPAITSKLIGLFSDEGMQRPFTPSLAQMTQTAIDILSKNGKGFFLMVEAGQIDWACHDNDAENAISDVLGLDAAVAVAEAFAARSEETLIIVTADHETGGMSVSWESSGEVEEDGPFFSPGGRAFYVTWSTTEHTKVHVPVTSMGPFSEWLAGVNDNTYLYDVMDAAFGGAGG